MEAITKKRKLNEIDTNIPFFPSSIPSADLTLRDAGKPIWKRLKHPKLITPSKGCENNLKTKEKDVEQTESPKLPRSSKKDESDNKSVLRCRMKTCDRKFKKLQIQDVSANYSKLDFTLDVVPPKVPPLEATVPLPDITDINLECTIQKETPKEKTVNELDTKEMKIWFACDYFEDIITHEFEKEKQFKLSGDYCKKYDIDPARREILIDWLISVQIHLKAGNATLHLAVSLLDILLDRIYIPCDQLQVSAIAAFWVAYKFIHGNLSVKTLTDLCAGAHEKNIILDHEILVLESSRLLQTGGNMSTFFIYLLFKLFGMRFPPEVYYCGQYFLEIMILHFVFIDTSACERAITAVYMALAIFEPEHRSKLIDFSQFITRKKLKIMCGNLLKYLRVMYRDEEYLRASNLFKKYKAPRYFKISVNRALKSFIL